MTGYQEILTDPSYAGQIVIMTQPEIGNYGVTPEDEEARRPFVRGFVVREYSPVYSNWRGRGLLDDYLKQHRICGIAGIDTRKLVRHIRQKGAMRGIISHLDSNLDSLREKTLRHPAMTGLDLVREVTVAGSYRRQCDDRRFQVVAYDFGIKSNILNHLCARGCDVTVVPAATSADEILKRSPDGLFLSNGPGDPEPLSYVVDNLHKLIGKLPVFGICLGHQLLGRALGGTTFKLKFGHRGGNHPVKNLVTGKVEITCQNHGFAVDPDSLDAEQVQLTHINLNDQTLEGLRHRYLPAFSVQYHPEASPGPHDSIYLFDEFISLMHDSRR